MNFFQPKLVLESDIPSGTANHSAADVHRPEQVDSFRSRRLKIARERDIQRGYSINVKQVVLAFAVEFWIIALIVVGTYLLITDSGQLSSQAIFSALLFPAALAMVELARVPLAIAVRTQKAWHIKLLSSLGVLAAITVTSFSLSQIAWKTFDNRIVEATQANDKLIEAKRNLAGLQERVDESQRDIARKTQDRKSANERLAGLQKQLTEISSTSGTSSKTRRGRDGSILQIDKVPTVVVNSQQINLIKDQIASTTKQIEETGADVRRAEEYAKTLDRRGVEDEVAKADAAYRAAVNKSQLHSYTAMVTGKAVADVTDAEVKNLEKYLIIIPSIAAALASTLIAITAVRIVRPTTAQPVPTIPDEAVAYLFGPLVGALRKEAREAVC